MIKIARDLWSRALLLTTQPPKKKNRGPASKTHDVEYYRKFTPQRANPHTPVVPADAHTGLTNCDMICYSNAIFQGIASYIHVSDFLQSPSDEEHKWFPLYHAFASVLSSIVSGQETVVDPITFTTLFRDKHNNVLQEGMYFDNQRMKHTDNMSFTNQLIILPNLRGCT